ncbi:class I SAM-dependent RNA methyltransferase [Sandaracinobacter sp. RS1-74]|uniref:class I SAM-dependent RNA methyltransferase n=1 Tax=Sandaracinobacteroides sayramensis TaxID=2913411 RepID=UPI001EDB799C|nr:class I SAM-dependent RNA methyltransferase [Sandaracinobacteroides sayramensis]MCG2841565.1 class I SAM-dependent RNA methyltransferase [Sandaracinobacteroides sayramensis]
MRLAARGDGVTADGRHFPGAVPGDRIESDGALVEGPNRQAPACRHYGDCGGCQLQHVPDSLLADFARDRVLEPLARAGVAPKDVQATHISPPGARRRAALRATRTDGEVRLGFNAAGEHRIVDLQECPVMHPGLFRLLRPLKALLAPHLGERSAIAVTPTLTDNGVDLLLGNLQANSLPVIEGLNEFSEQHDLARLSIEGPMGIETLATRAAPSVRMGEADVTLPPAAFLQATADGEAALVSAVRSIVGKAKRVADLFSGCGTFSFPLAMKARVTAADGTGPAIRALETAARRSGAAIETQHRDLFRKPLSADELNAFDAVVLDPPRAGAQAQAGQLALSRVPVVAAVSCNPATFARDAEMLAKGGYRLRRLWPVAQFRWSTHVELVAEFRR